MKMKGARSLNNKLMTLPASNAENPAESGVDASNSVSPAPRVLPSRIFFFVIVAASILLTATWFVSATWNHFSGMTAMPTWEIIFPALTLTFIVTMFLGMRHSSFELRLAYRISVIWLGVLNFGFFAAVAAWIVSAAADLVSFR